MWGSQTAFHWGPSCCGQPQRWSETQKTNPLFGSHTWFPGFFVGYSVTPGCWILGRLWKISVEGPFLLINHLPESLQCMKMEIEAQRVKGSRRRYRGCVAEFHSGVGMSQVPFQVPGWHGREVLRQHEERGQPWLVHCSLLEQGPPRGCGVSQSK